jgi:phage tail sheath protein FI
MSEPTYPGVYLRETSSGPGAITGVSTSNLGLVGWTSRGRIDYPVLCTSFADYVGKFGGFTADGLAPTMAYAFFANGGQRLYMVRVAHSDAVDASCFWYKTVTGEVLGHTVEATGLYVLSTNKVPIVPGSVRMEFEAAVTNNIFEDDGAGAMTFVVAGSGGGGGSGSIDYESGEISIQLTVPGDYIGGGGGANDQTCTYDYRVATFTMQWPGVVGNLFRVRITGSPNYYDQDTASYSAYKVMVEENVAAVGATASWQTDETFDEVVLDDATDAKYFKTIMGDVYKGSQIVTVTDYGNAQDIAALNGVAVTAENFAGAQVPAYDGTTKAFAYTMANAVAPGTLEASFQFTESLYRIGTGDGTAAPACNQLGHDIEVGGGTAATAKVVVNLTLSIAGAIAIYDDGLGSLRTGPFPGVVHGTVSYTTGQVTLATAGGNVVVGGSAIRISAVYSDAVVVVDDGNGGVSVQTPAVGTDPPTEFGLNSSGTNSIDYDTGVLTLTWKITGRPADGPAGLNIATAAAKTSTAGPWVLTPGCAFDLDVDGAGAPTTITFNATQGYVDTTNVWPVADCDGFLVTFAVNGINRTVTFAGVTTTQAAVMLQINAQIPGIASYDAAGAARTIADRYGSGSNVTIVANTTAMTFAAPVAGTGDASNIEAVTAAEYETLVEGLVAAVAVTDNGDGTQTTTSLTTGVASELTFSNPVPAGTLTALGIVAPLDVFGTAGSLAGSELADYYTQPSDEVIYTMTSGSDGTATTRADVTAAALEANAEGVYALSKADEIMQVVIADFQTDDAVCRDVITFCENMGDKFGLFTVPEGLDEQEAVNWRKFTLAQYSNKVAAPYYPHVAITDPVSEATLNIPIGGHVAGIYARTDNNKNVGKNPAGVEDGALRWLEGLEVDLTRAQVGYCDQNMVNCLVSWTQTGMCVWGCNTLEVPGGQFVYVSQRRLFQYVEKSIFNATHIHVFQNNGPALWAAIRLQVTSFLMGLFNAGYLAGTTPDEAFFVVCDETNNDADTALVYCDVGLAVSKPAKFLIFSFSQLTIG